MADNRTIVTPLSVGEHRSPDGKSVMYWVDPPRHLGMWFGYEPEQELLDWCETTFGPDSSRSTQFGTWFVEKRKFYFANEHDRTMFLLRIAE